MPVDPQQLGQTIAHVRGAVRALETAAHIAQGQVYARSVRDSLESARTWLETRRTCAIGR